MGEHIDDLQSVIRTVRQAIFDLPTAGADVPRVRTSLAQMVTALTADAPLMVPSGWPGRWTTYPLIWLCTPVRCRARPSVTRCGTPMPMN